MTKEKKKDLDPLFEEFFKGIKSDIHFTLIFLFVCLFLSLSVRFILNIFLPTIIFVIIFVWFFLYLLYNYFLKKKKNRRELATFHFRNIFFDLLLLTVVIHYLGGVEWIGAIFYMAVIARSSNVLSRKQGLFLAISALFFYSILAFLEYWQILSHQEVFGPSVGFYKNPLYVIVQILVLAAVFIYVVQNYGTFSEASRKKQEELIKVQKEVEEAKNVLEIKVSARTKELQELAEGLEGQVKERTKEFQAKMEELEKFNKIAVGRELKMIELKKEIEKLKKEIEKQKNKIS